MRSGRQRQSERTVVGLCARRRRRRFRPRKLDGNRREQRDSRRMLAKQLMSSVTAVERFTPMLPVTKRERKEGPNTR